MSDRIILTVDGKQAEIQAGATILDAARHVGVEIPTLCDEPGLDARAQCRICVVEIEGRPRLEPACATLAEDGMIVRTDSDRVLASRRTTLELLLSESPPTCPTRAIGAECKLCDYVDQYGTGSPRFGRGSEGTETCENPFMIRNPAHCILCSRCVRVCAEIQGTGALAFMNRGIETEMRPALGRALEETDCEMCGNCVAVCPTGSLRAANLADAAGARKVRTTCTYCGVGCQLDLNVRDGRIVGVTSAPDNPVNGRWLCVKGRFGYEFINHPDRLTTPLIRRDGELQPATWDEALDYIASKLTEIKASDGPDAIALMSSSRCTNEENYLMQKLARAVIGTNSVDQCARTCHAPTVAGLATAFGSGAMTNSIGEIPHSDVIFMIGANPTEAHPVIGLKIKEAVRNGARLIVADPRRIWLTKVAWLHMPVRPGTDLALINGMAHVILSEGLANEEFIQSRTEGFEEFRKVVEEWPPERAAEVCEIPAEDIRRAAVEYACADRGSIIYTLGITEHTCGTRNVLGLANLAMLTGQIGRESTGINPLRGQNNVQGACDMGALPDTYPGYQKVAVEENRRKFEEAWGVELPQSQGMMIPDMLDAAIEGRLKAMYILGEDPIMSEAHAGYVRQALSRLELIVVQEIFLNETAKAADVVLPASCFAEKDGTFTNSERRVQRIRKAVEPPGEAREDWRVIVELSNRLGYPMDYSSPREIWAEIARLSPIFSGISYERIDKVGIQFPCPAPDHPGTKFLHAEKFTRGLGKFHPVYHTPPNEMPDSDYPWILSTGRTLYHYNVGTMTRRVAGIGKKSPDCFVEINPSDLEALGAEDGQMLRVSTRRGSIVARAAATKKVKPGRIWMPFHFAESSANELTIDAYDDISKTAEYKVCAALVEAVDL